MRGDNSIVHISNAKEYFIIYRWWPSPLEDAPPEPASQEHQPPHLDHTVSPPSGGFPSDHLDMKMQQLVHTKDNTPLDSWTIPFPNHGLPGMGSRSHRYPNYAKERWLLCLWMTKKNRWVSVKSKASINPTSTAGSGRVSDGGSTVVPNRIPMDFSDLESMTLPWTISRWHHSVISTLARWSTGAKREENILSSLDVALCVVMFGSWH